MISLQKPSDEQIKHFLRNQSHGRLTYEAVGATAAVPPVGYLIDHRRTRLGEGPLVFAAARAALATWRHLSLGWLQAYPARPGIEAGNVVAVLVHRFGCWWWNACRIVYVANDQGARHCFGFAYGTLPKHVEDGEERFLVEWDRDDDSVWYDILAFSRPRHPLARLGYPLVRRTQQQFGRESSAAMARVISRVQNAALRLSSCEQR